MVATFLQYFGVIYGLLLGLLAVATYQNRLEVEKSNANEAASLLALYRNVAAYPEPSRTELQNLLKDHTRYLLRRHGPSNVGASFLLRRLPCSKHGLRFSNHRPKRKRAAPRKHFAAVQHLLRTSKGAHLQPHRRHPRHPLVHSGSRRGY